jgi:hypothetical protein
VNCVWLDNSTAATDVHKCCGTGPSSCQCHAFGRRLIIGVSWQQSVCFLVDRTQSSRGTARREKNRTGKVFERGGKTLIEIQGLLHHQTYSPSESCAQSYRRTISSWASHKLQSVLTTLYSQLCLHCTRNYWYVVVRVVYVLSEKVIERNFKREITGLERWL